MLAGPQPDVKPYYVAADAFVLPTIYDPCPNAALEAMACGLPIITSDKSGAAEIALEHAAGLVCGALDVDALSAHMRSLPDPATRGRMGANARPRCSPLSPSAMTLKMVLLKELLAASVAHRRPTAARPSAAAPPRASHRLNPPARQAPRHAALYFAVTLPRPPAHGRSATCR